MLKANLTFKDVEEILMDEQWPHLPFLAVAQAQGKTRMQNRQDGQGYKHLKDVKNVYKAREDPNGC